MAIAASGTVSMSDLRTEYNDTGSIALSDLYLGGASNLVRANANNNSSTNLSAGVPASGVIKITDFYSKARGFRKTYSSNAENQDLSTVFGSDWGVDYPKDVVINAGVTLGATSTANEALEVNTGGLGTITITNNGSIIGAGGAAGADGGDAFEASVACTFVNNNQLSAGGGGGGQGGQGGNGQTSSTSNVTTTHYSHYIYGGYTAVQHSSEGGDWWWKWQGTTLPQSNWGGTGGYLGTWHTYGGYTYGKGAYKYGSGGTYQYEITRTGPVTTTTNYNGTAGGAGGVGAGYSQSATAGASASTATSPAGTGGQGGTGGGLGSAGNNGSAGANGNSTNGASGGTAGAGGVYIRGISNVTFTNNGTVNGSTA